MKSSTLCYIEKDGAYLMMHRIKKKNDENHDKWIGAGGKLEKGETPDECVLREVMEETGFRLLEYRLRGIIDFRSDIYEDEKMYLYTATEFEKISEPVSDEGVLEWIPKTEVGSLPIWEGDRLFFEELERDRGFFQMTLEYEGEKLKNSTLVLK